MDNTARTKKAKTLTSIGLAVMFLMTLTKFVPSTNIAGYSVFAGIAFFFIVEAVAKTPDAESGLRFKTFFADFLPPLFAVSISILKPPGLDMVMESRFFDNNQSMSAIVISVDKAVGERLPERLV